MMTSIPSWDALVTLVIFSFSKSPRTRLNISVCSSGVRFAASAGARCVSIMARYFLTSPELTASTYARTCFPCGVSGSAVGSCTADAMPSSVTSSSILKVLTPQ
jgi:hypothetical protein